MKIERRIYNFISGILVKPPSTTLPALIVKALASQTESVQKWTDSDDDIMSEIGPDGTFIGPVFLNEFRIHGWHDPTRSSAWANNFSKVNFMSYNLSPLGTATGYLEWDMWLPAGTYQCIIESLTSNNIGIGEVLVDGNSFGTYDPYGATANQRHDHRLATTQVLTAGLHTIRLYKTGTKNASSSQYYIAMTQITLVRL